MNLTKLQFFAVFLLGVLARNLALGGQNPLEIPDGDARTTVSKSEVIEIAQLVAKRVVTKRFDAQYRCTVEQYYGATDRCEECSLLCEPAANKKMCSLECPAVYARLYLVEPINATVKALTARVKTAEEQLSQMKQAFDEYRRYQDEKDAAQDRDLLILLCCVVAIIVASLVVASALLWRSCSGRRNSEEKSGFPSSNSIPCDSRRDSLLPKDPEKQSLTNEDEISGKNFDPSAEEQSPLKGIPPQNNSGEEFHTQGPSSRHAQASGKEETHPMTIMK